MRRFLAPLLLIRLSFFLAAQEEPPPSADQTEATEQQTGTETPGPSQEEELLELDIKTSSLTELASWCRSLGLSEGGTKADLANRLRSYFKLPAQGGTVSEDRKVITIESARTTEYFTLDIVDEEYARLTGDVILSLKDGNAVHRITAWEILYNRTRNIMTASGGVVYVKEEDGVTETFRGDSITVNLDNWASIFLDGSSERAIAEGNTAYRFSGTVISRNSEEVTVLTRAEITNAQNEEALWSLYASKLWLLPGSDWAVLNAVLKVGNIPVLWLPFFYYPSDEIVFHPVLGVRSREGTFLQTTTYILGRPKTSAVVENSITRIFGAAQDGPKEREGLFLRATGEKTVSSDEPRLSVLFDAYTNLGFYLGTEFYLPGKNNFGAFNLSLGLGFTRNIYQVSGINTPFASFTDSSEWNSSYLFAFKVPFRYRMEMTGSLRIGQGSLSWNIPFYSDPYVRRDFMDRSETLDWLAMLREGATALTDDTSTTATYLSSYEMRLNGSFSVPLTGLSPYISSFSMTGISSSLSFSSRNTSPMTILPSDTTANPVNPGRMFFFPNKLVILSASASLTGTPYTTSPAVPGQPQAPDANSGEALLPAAPVSPWEVPVPEDTPGQAAGAPGSLVPPVLNQRFETATPGSPRVAIDYSLSPSAASELQFGNISWQKAEDIDWSEVSSVLTRVKSDASLGINLSHSGGSAYSASLRLTGTGSWQGYNYLNEDTVPAIGADRRRAYNETFVTSSYNFSASVRPFFLSPVWGNTSLSYNIRGLLARTVFSGTNVTDTLDQPEWTWEFGEWSKEKLDTHSVSARIEAAIMDKVQSITVSTVLPPRDSQLTGDATFRAWISETRVRNTILEPFSNDKRVIQPVYFTETLKFTDWLSFEQYLTYNPAITEFTALTSSLSLWKFSAKYQMAYISPYFLNYDDGNGNLIDPARPKGWIQIGDRQFKPQELTFSFSSSLPKTVLGPRGSQFNVSVSAGLVFDLQRYTYSKLTFSLSLGLQITNFLELQFSTSSENAQMYRYFRDLPFFTSDVPLSSEIETNFFVDLFNSFRFDNTELRRRSAFKLKNFRLDLTHHLGDWDAVLGITMAPYLSRTSSPPTWKFNNQISFIVRWIPIGEIRTEIGMGKNTTTDMDEITFK